MITDFCVICGTKEKLHNHHIVPKARDGGDESTNLLTLCETHHEWIHQIRPSTFNKMSELAKIKQKEGIEKAKKLLNYDPQWPLEKGYPDYIKWYKDIFKDFK